MNMFKSLFRRLMSALHTPVYEARLRELVLRITPYLQPGDRVLDVGCGTGNLGHAILQSDLCPSEVVVEGLERVRRGGEPITVTEYNGKSIPHEDNTYDVVIVADVLHHEKDPERLLRECMRVSRRLLIVKDHQIKGPLAWLRVSFIDWAANAPYGVPCLYRYNTPKQWQQLWQRYNLEILEERPTMELYPQGVNFIFGGSLQYMAVLHVNGSYSEETVSEIFARKANSPSEKVSS
jgi:ubiquinone/menaquinone biosynthesis C-methylase UbiE